MGYSPVSRFLSASGTAFTSAFLKAITINEVTGAVTIGSGGTGTNTASVNINGGSGTAGGPYLQLSRNSVGKSYIGQHAAIFGGTSDDLAIYSESNNIRFFAGSSATVAEISSTRLAVTGKVRATSSDPDFELQSTSGTQDNWRLRANSTDQRITLVNDTSGYGIVLTVSRIGNIAFNRYGAGTLVTDASGNITASSDARMKNIEGDFTRGLQEVLSLAPRLFRWNKESGLDTKQLNAGFVAQDVLPWIPEAVGEKDGRYSLSDRPLIAALVNAAKELNDEIKSLRRRVAELEGVNHG